MLIEKCMQRPDFACYPFVLKCFCIKRPYRSTFVPDMKEQWNIYYLINFNWRSLEGGTCFGSLWIFFRLVLIVEDRLGSFGSFCLVSRFISDWPNKNRLWRVQFILCIVFGSLHERVVFRLNKTWKTILSYLLRLFKTLSPCQQRLLKRVKNSRVEVDAYCFEVLARAMVMKFKLTVALNLMLKRTKTTKN